MAYQSVNPYDGKILKTFEELTDKQLEIALETAARHPARVSSLSLIGTAATMTVGPALLKAASILAASPSQAA